jgi:hypothetical protein
MKILMIIILSMLGILFMLLLLAPIKSLLPCSNISPWSYYNGCPIGRTDFDKKYNICLNRVIEKSHKNKLSDKKLNYETQRCKDVAKSRLIH